MAYHRAIGSLLQCVRARTCLQYQLRRSSSNAAGPLQHIMSMVDTGQLRHDTRQLSAVEMLQQVHDNLEGYASARQAYHVQRDTWRRDVAVLQEQAKSATAEQGDQKQQTEPLLLPNPPEQPLVHGLYLWGGVGTGKSMLMDTFYSQAPVAASLKRRVHFHQFMIEVHERLHEWQQERIRTHGRQSRLQMGEEADSVYQVGLQLGSELVLLCFDEFQVSDVADALIIRRLFSALFAEGVVVVATSNRLPEQLYEAGLNRSYFEPFIPLLRDKCDVHAMDSETDHRRFVTAAAAASATDEEGYQQLYFTVAADGRDAFEAAWDRLVAAEAKTGQGHDAAEGQEQASTPVPMHVDVRQGRRLPVPQAVGGVCRFDYGELCAADVGAADFAAVAATFHTVVLDNVPQLSTARHNEASRFVTLVDELYEQRCRFGCFALASLPELFDSSQEVTVTDDAAPASPFVMGLTPQKLCEGEHAPASPASEVTIAVDPAAEDLAVSGAEFAAIHELRLAFARAESRLVEMMGAEYRWKHYN